MNAPNPYGQFVPQVTQPKHSGVGIGSFVISILNGALMLILIILATVMVEDGVSEDDAEMQVVGVFFLGSILLAVIGGVLGIITCFQKDKKKVLGIIGLVLNVLTIFGVVILMAIGFIADA